MNSMRGRAQVFREFQDDRMVATFQVNHIPVVVHCVYFYSESDNVRLQIGTAHSWPFFCTCFPGKSLQNMYRGMAGNVQFLSAILHCLAIDRQQ